MMKQDMQTACEVTGLSEKAIRNLKRSTAKVLFDQKICIDGYKTIDGMEFKEVLNFFLESRTFSDLVFDFF